MRHDGNQTPLQESLVDKREESNNFGATRVTVHPILGELPTEPLVEFTFDGDVVAGRAGEPIAAALFAAGYRVLRTMPRFGDSLTPVSVGLSVETQHGLGKSAWREAWENRS
jgi:hypothetical protein